MVVLTLLTVLPAVAGVALLVAGRRTDAVAPAVGVVVAVIGLAAAIVATVLRPALDVLALPGLAAALSVDGLSAVALITVAGVFLAVMVFAVGDLGKEEDRSRFFGTMLLFIAAMVITVTAVNTLTLLAAWEVMGSTSAALIGFWWQEPKRVRSGRIAFITTRSADVGLYVAAGAALAGGSSTLGLEGVSRLPEGWRDVAVAGLALAALGKSAQLPFSFWLSHAMAGPSPVSALLHSATMVAAGGYLLLRIEPALSATDWAVAAVAWVGVATAVLLGTVAIAQNDLKQLLAASTCSQIGFIVLAAGAGSVSGGAAQFVAHAAVKSLLFLVAGAWLSFYGTKDLQRLRGVARAHPVAGVTFTIGALALAGLAPFSIWVAKDQILSAAVAASPALYIASLTAAAVSAGYAAKALVVVWTGPRTGARADAEHRRMPLSELLPLPVLAVFAAALGLLGVPPLSGAWSRMLGSPAAPPPALWELVVSGAIAVAATTGMALWQRRRLRRADALLSGPRWLRDWLGLEAAAQVVLVRPIDAAATWCARFDDQVVARATTGLASGALRLARSIDAHLEQPLAEGVAGFARGARRLGALAVRPQTGMIHQYYAQAIIVTIVLAVVFAVVR